MSELSQSLIDAAAEAFAVEDRADDACCLECGFDAERLNDGVRLAVVAVLETLDREVMQRVLADGEPVDLAGLASEVREGSDA